MTQTERTARITALDEAIEICRRVQAQWGHHSVAPSAAAQCAKDIEALREAVPAAEGPQPTFTICCIHGVPVDKGCDQCAPTLDSAAARPAPTQEQHPSKVFIGFWPEHCEQRAFVDGAAWQMWRTQGFTPFSHERDQMEEEAVKRYGEPAAPARADAPQENTMDAAQYARNKRQGEPQLAGSPSSISRRNWHSIIGPNGMCECGVKADGTVVNCSDLLVGESPARADAPWTREYIEKTASILDERPNPAWSEVADMLRAYARLIEAFPEYITQYRELAALKTPEELRNCAPMRERSNG